MTDQGKAMSNEAIELAARATTKTVKTHKAFRFRVYPNADQQRKLAGWESAQRFLWNLALEQHRLGHARPRGERIYPTAYDQMRELTSLRSEIPWLKAVPRHSQERLLKHLEAAWQRCFERKAGAPTWKKKHGKPCGFGTHDPTEWRLTGSELRFAKLGKMRAVVHRPIEGRPLSCSLNRDGDQWFVTIACEIEAASPAPRHEPRVALDRGIVNMVADSNGVLTKNPRFYEHSRRLLARAQRSVSRKQKGSKNREKAKLRVARLSRTVRRQREHVIHSLSAAYAKNHGMVVVEKLNTSGMVRGNRGLARGILDSGWGKLVGCLRYKLEWSGGSLIEVSAHHSSQTCAACGHVDSKSRRSQSGFICTDCGHVDHADLNAAKVLLNRANRSVLPVEGTVPKAAQRSRNAGGHTRV